MSEPSSSENQDHSGALAGDALPQLVPHDAHNRALVDLVRPPDWVNPRPADRYDLVVIGGGTAGLVAAAGAAGVGAKVALVEKQLLGGDCLNTGCVPSKALLAAARTVAEVRRAGDFGVHVPEGVRVDFPAVMERMRRLRAKIGHHDSAERFRSLGIDVFLGAAEFVESGNAVRVGDSRLSFRKAVLCTGARAAIPPIPGLAESGGLTNETLFSLTELPRRLVVIGGGPIGCEMAQAFARFGAQVTLYEASSRLLPRDDPDASLAVMHALRQDGVNLCCDATVQHVATRSAEKVVVARVAGAERTDECDAILVAAGRAPNVEGLNLAEAGVEVGRNGVQVDDCLRTTNRRIFASGDVCYPARFTHAADFLSRIVVRNALFFGRQKASRLLIPWCTYTSPEVAHVGLLPEQAEQQGLQISTFTLDLSDVDRAVLEGESEGFVKVHVRKGSDRIVGATIVAAHAGDLISEIAVAIKNGVGLTGIGNTIHPYPTQAEAIRKLGDQYNRTRLTPFTRWVLKTILSFN
ncbi:MAG: mercuric reductase [Planctomycetaceae bacterium]|nr:mercuric reductase [Planctomycetaceae bacterium]